MGLLDKLVEGRKGATVCLPSDPCRERYPVLWSFLTRIDAGNGWEKDVATLSVRLGVGAWVVELTDGTLEVSISATAASLDEAMISLETALNLPTPPIRPWKGSKGRLKKKRATEGEQ